MVLRARLNDKLSALRTKNIAAIVAAQPHIPGLADGYDATGLQSWIDDRVNILTQAIDATDAQIKARAVNAYQSLTVQEKAAVDNILTGGDPPDWTTLGHAKQLAVIALILLRDILPDLDWRN